MTPEESLRALAEIAESTQPNAAPGSEVGERVLALALRVSRAQGAFLARAEDSSLRMTVGVTATGESLVVPGRELARVARAVQESLDGVRDAPPTMTGGEPPHGAVAIKAEAGHPPIHAFPLFDSDSGGWTGVLGLHPDPAAPEELSEAEHQLLFVLCRLVSGPLLRDPVPEFDPELGSEGEQRPFKYRYDELVTNSPKMHTIFKKLDRVIGTTVPVLVCGQTGTGKELVARAIHRNDPNRRSRRFYAQNCAAITQTLLESELFGHTQGAFTGADRNKQGLFQIASGSTLFLDEIGEMSVDMQTKLLRVLQEKEVVPVGANEPIKIDVRLVAATHRDLDAEVAAGRFRSDLYYRLKVVRFTLPPLHERPEDVPLLVDHFLRRVANERGQRPKVLDRRDERILETLCSYPWPGNVRELENAIKRLAYLCPGDVITYESLTEENILASSLVGEEEAGGHPVRPLDEVVEEVERGEIDNALKQTGGNRTQAASLLGINRRSLLRRLRKYGYIGADEDV